MSDDKDDEETYEFVTDEQLAKVEMIDDEGYCNLSDLHQLADGTFVAGQGHYELDVDSRTLRPIQGAHVVQANGIQYIISGLNDDKAVAIDSFDHFAAEVSSHDDATPFPREGVDYSVKSSHRVVKLLQK